MSNGLERYSVTSRSSDAVSETVTDTIAKETPVAISYNGVSHAVMMASPTYLEDFAYGFSLTEGIIQQPTDLLAIESQTAMQGIALQLKVRSESAKNLVNRKRSLTGRAGCGICGLTELSAAVPTLESLDVNVPPSHSAIDCALEAMQSLQAMQLASGGIHGAALCTGLGEVKIVREDVGRHNALDKLIGAAIRSRVESTHNAFEPSDFILISSRASHELVNKCVIARVNSLVTLSAATTLAIDVARNTKLNLIGFVRGKRQLIYHQNN